MPIVHPPTENHLVSRTKNSQSLLSSELIVIIHKPTVKISTKITNNKSTMYLLLNMKCYNTIICHCTSFITIWKWNITSSHYETALRTFNRKQRMAEIKTATKSKTLKHSTLKYINKPKHQLHSTWKLTGYVILLCRKETKPSNEQLRIQSFNAAATIIIIAVFYFY